MLTDGSGIGQIAVPGIPPTLSTPKKMVEDEEDDEEDDDASGNNNYGNDYWYYPMLHYMRFNPKVVIGQLRLGTKIWLVIPSGGTILHYPDYNNYELACPCTHVHANKAYFSSHSSTLPTMTQMDAFTTTTTTTEMVILPPTNNSGTQQRLQLQKQLCGETVWADGPSL
ncbi:hypothetical protein B0H10DRAFT_1968633 [Mycena sp. CBHHK59/15]|nr:hypothetical protein B0H10DRAFT_1968633 [Mycena sp. CBHHK59/15]